MRVLITHSLTPYVGITISSYSKRYKTFSEKMYGKTEDQNAASIDPINDNNNPEEIQPETTISIVSKNTADLYKISNTFTALFQKTNFQDKLTSSMSKQVESLKSRTRAIIPCRATKV